MHGDAGHDRLSLSRGFTERLTVEVIYSLLALFAPVEFSLNAQRPEQQEEQKATEDTEKIEKRSL